MARGVEPQKTDLPNAVEAEQALLGAVLSDNSAFALLPHGLSATHFYEPLHQRLYQRLKMAIDRGQLADPVILASAMQSDPALNELGGIKYLVDLVLHAPPGANAPDYAREVMQVGVRRRLVLVGQELIARGQDGGEDADTLLADLERSVGDLHMAGNTMRLVDSDEAMDRVLDYIDNPGSHAAGITTGLESLDQHLGPILPGDLIVLAARPGMGKSAAAAIIDQNVALQGGGVIEIHAEMSVEQAWRRRMTAMAFQMYATSAPAYSAIRKRLIEYNQRQMLEAARDKLRGIPLKAIKRTGLTLGRLRAIATHQRAQWERKGVPLSLLTIDHVGLIRSDREHTSRVDQQTEISNGLKELADDLGVPILALAQLNRQVESRDDKRPTLPDLRDSGSWEQDADIVIGLYRDAYYASREKEPSQKTAAQQLDWAEWDRRRRSPWIEALLLKVREGETGVAKLWAHMPTNAILGSAPQDDIGGLI